MYGIQPIWPSAYITLRFGKRSNLPLISQSTIEKQQLAKVIVEPTAGGAPAEGERRRRGEGWWGGGGGGRGGGGGGGGGGAAARENVWGGESLAPPRPGGEA